jgi:N-acetyl-anhydromuramyl-L-alanine amidase AmpD
MSLPRYPDAKWVPADKSNYRSSNRPTFLKVIIHVTDGHADPMPVAQMWQQKDHGSSAHFVIGQDGALLQCVDLKDTAWHAHRVNGISAAIEHCARTPKELGPHDPGLPVSDAQYTASAKLVSWLCKQAGLPITRQVVQGHAEADVLISHKDCPTGAGFDLDKLVALAASV